MSEYRILVEGLDSDTKSHSERVSKYAVLLGKKVGLSDEDLEKLKIGALYHDIGKTNIPSSILQKETKLTTNEYFEIQKHTSIGANMLKKSSISEDIIPIIKYHHEKYDGTGYPYKLSGETIPYLARITSIADCFDAMTSKRIYKDPITIENAINEFKKCKGTQFDPELTNAFLEILENNYDEIEKIQKNIKST